MWQPNTDSPNQRRFSAVSLNPENIIANNLTSYNDCEANIVYLSVDNTALHSNQDWLDPLSSTEVTRIRRHTDVSNVPRKKERKKPLTIGHVEDIGSTKGIQSYIYRIRSRDIRTKVLLHQTTTQSARRNQAGNPHGYYQRKRHKLSSRPATALRLIYARDVTDTPHP
jgi:hypothetical protein